MKFTNLSSVFTWAFALLAACVGFALFIYHRIEAAPPAFFTPLAVLFAALLAVLLAVASRPVFGRLRHLGRVKFLRFTCPGLLAPLLIVFSALAVIDSQAAGTNVFQPGQQPRIYAFGGFPTFMGTNATTNFTAGGVPVVAGRPISILNSARTAGTENTMMIVSFEASTNKPGSSATNWFRPLSPITATFTNNGVATTNNGYALIPATSFDSIAQIRPFSARIVIGTNFWTNLTFAAAQTLLE